MGGIRIWSFFLNNRQLLLLGRLRTKRHSRCFLFFDRIGLIEIPLGICSVRCSYKARSLRWKFTVIISLNEPYILARDFINWGSRISNSSLWLIRLSTTMLFSCSTVPLLFLLVFKTLTLSSFDWHIVKRVNELFLVLTLISILCRVDFGAFSRRVSVVTTVSTCSMFTLSALQCL